MENPDLEIYRFQIQAEFKTAAILPEFKGATFRGAFGISLREITCVNKPCKDCKLCLINKQCPYKQIFSVESEENRFHNIPSPFILEPPYDRKKFYDQRSKLCFNFVVIGKMIEYFPYIVLAFKRMGEKGIGIKDRRGSFVISKIESNNGIVYDGEKEILSQYKKAEKIDISELEIEAVRLKFISPARIKSDGKLIKDLPFALLVKSILRRIFLLKKNYCENSDFNVDHQSIIKKACAVETISCNLKWYDWERFSTSQKTNMRLGGFVGEIDYMGKLGDFIRYLKIGEIIHVGKNASFGLGKYAIISQSYGKSN